jgi:hypothetical protein
VHFELTSAEGKPGETVTIKLRKTSVEGVALHDMRLSYDPKALTPKSVKGISGGILYGAFGEKAPHVPAGEILLSWVSADEVTGVADLAELTFEIAANASEGTSAVKILPGAYLLNEKLEEMTLAAKDGTVTVKVPVKDPLLYGDSNCDGKANSIDTLLIMQYRIGKIALPDQGKLNADCYPDGAIDAKDVLMLMRVLGGDTRFMLGKIPEGNIAGEAVTGVVTQKSNVK